METSGVFDEDLMNPHTEPRTLQTDRASASWVANGHRAAEINTARRATVGERGRGSGLTGAD